MAGRKPLNRAKDRARTIENNARAINEDKEKTERKPTPREWAKWAGYDCGE